jgi:hypothetical protein
MTRIIPFPFQSRTEDGQMIPRPPKGMANLATATVYALNGGDEWYADWAARNPDDFFKSMFSKLITKEVEHNVSEGVEELLDRLDEQERIVDVTPHVVED